MVDNELMELRKKVAELHEEIDAYKRAGHKLLRIAADYRAENERLRSALEKMRRYYACSKNEPQEMVAYFMDDIARRALEE